jgi:serine/threonine protein kinase
MPDQPPQSRNDGTSGSNPPPFQDEYSSLGAPANKPAEDREEWLADLMGRQSAPAANTGGTIMVENYMDLNPQMREDVDMVLSLIEREIKARVQRGEKPDINEYLRRFPSQEKEIRSLFERVTSQAAAGQDTSTGHERHTPPRYESQPRYESHMGATAMPGAQQPMQSPSRRGGPSSMQSMASVHIMQCARAAGYDLLSELGRGGMGVVYKAQQIGLKRMIALKMILAGAHASGEQLARFKAEAEAVAKLQHPNIVQVYDTGELDGNPYLALEYVDGGSLEDKLKGQPMPPLQAAMLIEPLARAVHVAHQLQIVHRDLKPANILLTSDGTPKISDFGLAKHMDDSSGWTRTGDIMGTPCYMAPEQAEGKIKKISGATDVYSLGAILYELLTGRPPFLGSSTLETLEQVRSLDPFPVSKFAPNCPRDMETITMKCLEKEPKNRYADGDALADDLKRFLCDEPILARGPGLFTRLGRWSKRNPTGAAAALTFVLLLIVAGAAIPLMMKEGEKGAAVGLGPTNTSKPVEQPTKTVPPERETFPEQTPIGPRNTGSEQPRSTPTRPPRATETRDHRPIEPVVLKYPELIAKAKAAAPTRPREALGYYLEAFEDKTKTRPTGQPPLLQYQELIGPAVDLISKIPDETNPLFQERIGALYAAKGDLIRRFPTDFDDTFGKTEPHEVGLEAYGRAINSRKQSKEDAVLGEYHSRHGLMASLCLKELKASDPRRASLIATLEEDAQKAVTLAPGFAGGQNLNGYVMFVKFEGTAKLEEKAQWLDKAVEAYSKAIEAAAKTEDDDHASYILNRSKAYVAQGLITTDESRRTDLYTKALADAKNAEKLGKSFATWEALGIAHELLRQYEIACEAFQKQHEARSLRPDGKANLGRAQARWFFDKHTDPSLVQKAVTNLDVVVRGDREKKRIDSHYWLGRLLVYQANERDRFSTIASIFLGWPAAALAEPVRKQAYSYLETAFGDATVGSVLRQDLLNYYVKKPMEMRKLLDNLIPADPKKWTHKDASFLARRALLIVQQDPGDLKRDEPRSIQEARAAFDLGRDPEDSAAKAFALDLLAQIRGRLLEDPDLSKKRREEYSKLIVDERMTLIEKYSDYIGWKAIANKYLADLEIVGNNDQLDTKKRIELLRRAATVAKAMRDSGKLKGGELSDVKARLADITRKISELEQSPS